MKQTKKRVLALFLALLMAVGVFPMGALAVAPRMTLRAESVSASAGAEVKVKLLLEENPGVASIGLTLAYDNILTLKSVEFNPELGGSTQLSPTLNSPAKLIWVNSAVNFTTPNTGSAQVLVNMGTAAGGAVQYAVGSGAYGAALPTATDAGTSKKVAHPVEANKHGSTKDV